MWLGETLITCVHWASSELVGVACSAWASPEAVGELTTVAVPESQVQGASAPVLKLPFVTRFPPLVVPVGLAEALAEADADGLADADGEALAEAEALAE